MSDEALNCAFRLLARREHGADELLRKLEKKGHRAAAARAALAECQRLKLQSDERYADSLCRTRIRQGYGPLRIRQELQSMNIDAERIEQALSPEADHWLACAMGVWKKKYGGRPSPDVPYAVLQKQKQFLLYRGFSTETIKQVFDQCLHS